MVILLILNTYRYLKEIRNKAVPSQYISGYDSAVISFMTNSSRDGFRWKFDNPWFLSSNSSKGNHCKYLNFSTNVYISVIFMYTVKFSKCSAFLKLFIDNCNFRFFQVSYKNCSYYNKKKIKNLLKFKNSKQIFLQITIEKTQAKMLCSSKFKIFTNLRNDYDLSSNDFKYFINRRNSKLSPAKKSSPFVIVFRIE
ncbi:hypothetical protein AGLY_015391 [Aphis glycines]|uniref:Uncharacterized protein n=1 Tax=Aphis glycines TaxID=307491 RepID=A0A6G0T1H3_APHGL|nr:hypothetical protein AGLY_015391 [Aphis glycines]